MLSRDFILLPPPEGSLVTVQWLRIRVIYFAGGGSQVEITPLVSHEFVLILNASFPGGCGTGHAEGEEMLLEMALAGTEECRL